MITHDCSRVTLVCTRCAGEARQCGASSHDSSLRTDALTHAHLSMFANRSDSQASMHTNQRIQNSHPKRPVRSALLVQRHWPRYDSRILQIRLQLKPLLGDARTSKRALILRSTRVGKSRPEYARTLLHMSMMIRSSARLIQYHLAASSMFEDTVIGFSRDGTIVRWTC